jgi:hypothetical protein
MGVAVKLVYDGSIHAIALMIARLTRAKQPKLSLRCICALLRLA